MGPSSCAASLVVAWQPHGKIMVMDAAVVDQKYFRAKAKNDVEFPKALYSALFCLKSTSSENENTQTLNHHYADASHLNIEMTESQKYICLFFDLLSLSPFAVFCPV